MEPTDYDQIYKDGNPPWDHGSADFNLEQIIERFSIQPGSILDVGCGMGNNCVWLATHGFQVHGFDLSETAIQLAKERFFKESLEATFQSGNFLTDPVEHAPFRMVFDRGCFHCIADENDRNVFAENIAHVLEPDGFWLSLIGNADEPEREVGPPQLSIQQLSKSVEPYFEIISIEAGKFGDKQEDPPWAWVCLFKKRNL